MSDQTNSHLVHAFVALQTTGGANFILVLLSAIVAQYRGARRHPTFFSFCLAWIVFCVAYSLLFLAGQQATTPDDQLCIVQSALVYSAPPLAASASIGLVTHLLLNILSALSVSPKKRNHSFATAALVVVPWILWIIVLIGVLLFGLQHPTLVEQSYNGTYCILIQTSIPKLTSIWAVVAAVALIAEETAIAVLLYRHRGRIAGFGPSSTMAVRVMIFIVLCVATIVVALVFIVTAKRGVGFDVLIAIIPFSASIIFGSQTELLRVWIFWKYPAKDTARGNPNGDPTVESTSDLTTIVSTTENCTPILPGQQV